MQIQNQLRKLKLKPTEVRRTIRALDASSAFSAPEGDLSVVFLDDERIARLHGDFLGDPSPTDVITFEGSPAMNFAGEICVSVDHAQRYAESHGVPFSRELTLYLVHGYLHLCGFDDTSEEKTSAMREAEEKALEVLDRCGAFPAFVYTR